MIQYPVNDLNNPFKELPSFLERLRSIGLRLWAGPSGTLEHLPSDPVGAGVHQLYAAKMADGNELEADIEAGLGRWLPGLFVSTDLLKVLRLEIEKDDSEVRRQSIWPARRTFVYVDISDFSKMPTGRQQFTISALVSLSRKDHWGPGRAGDVLQALEAELCIGDGYIYVFRSALDAAYFAGRLAKLVEREVAARREPEFHFRIGVHVGEVRYFWDPGRNAWNFVGAGINGGQRVLATIVDADDVVFVSGDVRQDILGSKEGEAKTKPLLDNMINRGRRSDKHGRMWRVYELNHHAAIVDD